MVDKYQQEALNRAFPQYHKVWVKDGRLLGKKGVGTGVEQIYTETQLEMFFRVLKGDTYES